MFAKKLQNGFIAIIIVSIAILFINVYNSYQFKNSPISTKIQLQIDAKSQEILHKIDTYYPTNTPIPLIITDKMPSNIYGLASLDKEGHIKVYINKKRIKESLEYILEDVIAHEYAHAIMFTRGYRERDDGHSKAWQDVCITLGGSRCNRFVNHQDIIYGKMNLF